MLSHLIGVLNQRAAPGTVLLGGMTTPGALGVEYFFVLSGFVMMTAHYADFGCWRSSLNFWWRRACRIYPLYWIILLPVIYNFYHGLPPALLTWQLFSLEPRMINDLIPPAWSLRYEIAFYIMLGICMMPYIGRFVLLGWVISVLWLAIPVQFLVAHGLLGFHQSVLDLLGTWNHFISVFELYFLAGLFSGWLFIKCPPSLASAAIGFVCGAALMAYGLSQSQWGFVYPQPFPLAVLSLGYAGIIFGFSMLERCDVLRLGKWANRLGAISYPLYISHAPLVYFLDAHIGASHHTAALHIIFFSAVAVIYGVAIFLAFGVDRPIQRALRRVRLAPWRQRANSVQA